jgi:hypothetical protein
MSTEQTTPAAAPSGPISLDQFVAEMDAEQAAPAVEEEDDTEAPEPVEAATESEAEEEAPEIEADAEEDEPEAPAEPIPDPPQSWSKEDHEAWAELTPKAREVVLRREKDRDAAVSKAMQQATEVSKGLQALASQTQNIAHLATSEFERKWGRGEEGEIDWVKLARLSREDPQNYDYTSTRAEFESERLELKQAQAAAAQQAELADRTYLAEQMKELERIAPELLDPKEGKARREKVTSYLIDAGFAPEVLRNISAVELKIAWKAARFDEMEAKAKQAATAPRRNPVATPAKPVRPAGSGDASPQRNLQGLSQRLTNSGKLDDFVALMDAEQAQAAAKAKRR